VLLAFGVAHFHFLLASWDADVSLITKRLNRLTFRLPGLILRASADQLASVFTDIFNLSLTQSAIPTCFKQTTKVPVPKNAKVTCLNDYHPVAMKYFERLVMVHINTIIPDTLDPLQFAYHSNKTTADTISIALHTGLFQMDKRNNYVRILFIDYSQAFNTIVPAMLITKLRTLGLNTFLCNWVLDFLTGRPQVERVGNNTSPKLILKMGAPQGRVLSPPPVLPVHPRLRGYA
jgi:hypothetical protein